MSHVRVSQKVKDVLLKNYQHINFHIKTKILADFKICISVPLMNYELIMEVMIN